jgi:hypothetical protein
MPITGGQSYMPMTGGQGMPCLFGCGQDRKDQRRLDFGQQGRGEQG